MSSATSSFLSAMDKHTPKQLGENGNPEYTWSHELKERIVQFYFQLVRCKNYKDTLDLSNILDDIISKLKVTSKDKSIKNVPEHYALLRALYKLIGHTRDIQHGKGERTLAYMQIYTWYKHYPNLAKYAFRTMVQYVDNDYKTNIKEHQYGSWSDVKYFCKYIYDNTGQQDHELVEYAIELICAQLKSDHELYLQNKRFSLAARWCPKEKQKQYGWIFKKIAKKMFPYTETSKTRISLEKAQKKCYMDLRSEYISPLNKALDTTHIKMCDADGRWSEIAWNNVTSKTLRNNTRAWQNKTKSGKTRFPDNEDRVICASKYEKHISDAVSGKNGAKIHGRVMNTYELVKDAINTSSKNKIEVDRINLQWVDSGEKVKDNLGNIIAMADTSASMTTDNSLPYYNAIGLSIRISEKANPAFKNRILQFSTNANWFNLNGYNTFYEKVKYMMPHINHASTNFVGAMKLILDAIIDAKLVPKDVCDMVLIVLSDMQINASSYGAKFDDVMYEQITEMYRVAGLTSEYKKAFTPPHIVFWNLTKTSGFPTKSTEKNVTMISGYSDTLLNNFLEKGSGTLKEYNPFDMFMDIVNHDNYKMLGNYFHDYFMPL